MSLTDDFKEALSGWASGVSVVSTRVDGLAYGMTVSSFSSLSLDPPLILVCIANTNRMCELAESAGGFTVSILERSQEAASNAFAGTGREPSATLDPDGQVAEASTAAGLPVVDHAAAWLDCALHSVIVEGDHTILCGRVREARADPGARPLLYYRRGYRGVEM